MGRLVKGKWTSQWYDTKKHGGEFVRESPQFHHWVTPDGRAGPTGEGGFKAESGRYHLYVSLACPWAHRTLIFRKLKGLETLIGVSITHPHMLEHGWQYRPYPGAVEDTVMGCRFHYELYQKTNPRYTGRVTVPVLWDKEKNCIVNNESADIIRIFNSAFDHLTGNTLDFYPEALRPDIERINQLVYANVNNGVYRAGFATSQRAYRAAVIRLFNVLDFLDQVLAEQRYLMGERLTEVDWRLFTTLIRFDAVYHGHFKANIRPLEAYAHLPFYVRDLYQHAGVEETVDFDHIKQHYYYSHDMINPTRIVPVGPVIDYHAPHGRA